MKVKAIIFDLFGTIVDGFIASSAGLSDSDFPAALGVPNDSFMQNWRKLIDKRTIGEFQTVEASIEHACNIIGACVTADQMAKAVHIRLQLTKRALTPRPDTITTLAKLKNDGFKIGLLSNCSIEIPLVWPETEFAGLFDVTVFSSRERVKKPAHEIYHLACERLRVKPEECVYIADGENFELKAAADVGMYPVLIRTPSRETRGEVHREAREWQGPAITTVPGILTLAP
jgi:putative hydrolase of the HAD superfamily